MANNKTLEVASWANNAHKDYLKKQRREAEAEHKAECFVWSVKAMTVIFALYYVVCLIETAICG